MVVDGVDRQADDFDVALVELGLEFSHRAELGGADRREILGMREQHGPRIADPIVELELALGRLSLEIRRGVANSQRHGYLLGDSLQCWWTRRLAKPLAVPLG